MKTQKSLQKCLREGAVCRAPRDSHMAEEWASLEDTLSREEERLVRKGESQLKKGKHVLWDDLKKRDC